MVYHYFYAISLENMLSIYTKKKALKTVEKGQAIMTVNAKLQSNPLR